MIPKETLTHSSEVLGHVFSDVCMSAKFRPLLMNVTGISLPLSMIIHVPLQSVL